MICVKQQSLTWRGEYANDYTTDAVSPAHKIANVEQSLEEIFIDLIYCV
jgi:hypothetical protein